MIFSIGEARIVIRGKSTEAAFDSPRQLQDRSSITIDIPHANTNANTSRT